MRYELKKATLEIRKIAYYKEGCTVNQDEVFCELIKSFANKAEALEALKGYYTTIDGNQAPYRITEYYVEEAEYDNDGEWIGGGNIWDFSKLVYSYLEIEGAIEDDGAELYGIPFFIDEEDDLRALQAYESDEKFVLVSVDGKNAMKAVAIWEL